MLIFLSEFYIEENIDSDRLTMLLWHIQNFSMFCNFTVVASKNTKKRTNIVQHVQHCKVMFHHLAIIKQGNSNILLTNRDF